MKVNEVTGLKMCSKCKRELTLDQYHKSKGRPDGYANNCKECAKKHGHEQYLKHIEKVMSQHKQYRDSHREENKVYRDSHREEIKVKQKKWRIENRTAIREKSKRFREENAERVREDARKRYYKYRDKVKDTQLKKTYGIGLVELEKIWEDQQGKCLVCNSVLEKRAGGYAIDHSHTTGKVRGLICSRCNLALGLVSDSEEVLLELVKYLKRGG